MRYLDEYRLPETTRAIAEVIAEEVDPSLEYNLMEFCGGHTHAFNRYALYALLPESINMIHGPGCPVCVLPAERIDMAMDLACNSDVIFCTYADMLKVPGSKPRSSLMSIKGKNTDIRAVYSTTDVLDIAKKNTNKQVIFFAIGFETTAPATAMLVLLAEEQGIDNILVFNNHVLTPPAMKTILNMDSDGSRASLISGIVGPAHVATVIGYRDFSSIADAFRIPIVISGFEASDMMASILMLVRQINQRKHIVENEYSRGVTLDGNAQAKMYLYRVFVANREFTWRGLGVLTNSALGFQEKYKKYDAESFYQLSIPAMQEDKRCQCGDVLMGVLQPQQCRIFATACTPSQPMGPCMVSAEGACAAHYNYGRFRTEAKVEKRG